MENRFFDENSSSEGMSLFVSSLCDDNCPQLGSKQDAATVIGYPNFDNRCYLHNTATEVTLNTQSSLCLTEDYESCPVFQRITSTQESELASSPAPWNRRVRRAAILLPLILIIAAALIWWPSPGTRIEDSTSKAAPLQKITQPKESLPSAASTSEDQSGASVQSEPVSTSQTAEEGGIQLDAPADTAGSAAPAPKVDEPDDADSGGFRVRIYD